MSNERFDESKYIKHLSTGNCIIHKGKGVKKRKSFPFPMQTIHSKPIIILTDEFVIYEHYGTWYLTMRKE